MLLSALPASFLGWSLFGAGAMVLGFLGLLAGRHLAAWLLGALVPVLSLGAAGLALVGAPPWSWPATLGLAALAGLLALARTTWPQQVLVWLMSALRIPVLQGVVLLLGGVGVLGWQMQQLEQQVRDLDGPALVEADPNVDLHPLEGVSATTDAGTVVELHLATRADGEAGERIEEGLIKDQQLARRVIQTGEPGLTTNCHGWVFTGGQHWLRGTHVEKILRDNNYTSVNTPTCGDLAIYRDAEGVVQHTGVVQGLTREGLILIESKWGQRGRYLHTAEEHAYRHCSCTYYRTTRSSHILRGLEGAKRTTTTAALSAKGI